jgi:inosine/xanthosine triphosphate pyrophosphatase family protein
VDPFEERLPRILLATTNPAKADKLRWLLDGLPVEPYTGDIEAPIETGPSYLENARLKAIAASVDGLAIASDGGVQIPALGDSWNGLYTARAAGLGVSEEERAYHLLGLMEGRADRRVIWTEAIAIANHGRLVASWEASGNEGVLTETYDPTSAIPGFWVYSLWYYPDLGKRYVDLGPEDLDLVDVTWTTLKQQVLQYFRAAGSQLV